jgi:hypothetical protein
MFTVNKKTFDGIKCLDGFVFESGLSYKDVKTESNIRSITDLIIGCIHSGLSEKEIAKKFNIDVISVMGKVKLSKTKSSTNNRFFELKNKSVVLTDAGLQRFELVFKK